jgi:hypothetical protein
MFTSKAGYNIQKNCTLEKLDVVCVQTKSLLIREDDEVTRRRLEASEQFKCEMM